MIGSRPWTLGNNVEAPIIFFSSPHLTNGQESAFDGSGKLAGDGLFQWTAGQAGVFSGDEAQLRPAARGHDADERRLVRP